MADEKCPDCGGTGKVVQATTPVGRFTRKPDMPDCTKCKGTGRVPKSSN